MFDPLSAILFAMLFALLSGAVLGFMQGSLPPDVQRSASDWRIGTLLVAGGCALLVGQAATENTGVLPIANGCWLLGLMLYWRSVRRFFALPDSLWLYVPVVLGIASNAYFVFVVPSVFYRVVIATPCWVALLLGSAITFVRNRGADRSISANVLTGIFVVLALFMTARGVYYLALGDAVTSIAQASNWVNSLTPLLAAVLPVTGTTVFVLLCFERIRRELHRAATIDMLTGLPNRLTIGERAGALFATARSLSLGFSIAVIDVDHFKQINDRHGHDAGDAVLRGVAHALAAHCRGANVVGRQGGEEFVALFDGASLDDALIAAERLRAAVAAAAHAFEQQTLQVTISIGVATFDADDREFADVLRRADRALYAAKDAGRNCVRPVPGEINA